MTTRTFTLGCILMTMVLAAAPLAAQTAEASEEMAAACVAEPPVEVLFAGDPIAEAIPQALCRVRADCPTGPPVSCSGSSCVALDSCYAWCDGVYYWCAPPPGIYCPPVA